MKHLKHLSHFQNAFAISVSLFLLLTAFAKATAITQDKSFLALPDAVFTSFKTRHSLTVAAILEIAVAVFVFFGRNRLSSMVACSWLVCIFVSYRMLAKAFFAKNPCVCLGGILDWSGIPQVILDAIPIVLLCYMGVGSLAFLAAASMPVGENNRVAREWNSNSSIL